MNQLVLSTLLLLLLLPGQLARACPTGCQCQDPTTILCAARRGHTVPRGLPPSTLSLYVFENGITMLSEDSFAGLPALQLLDLSQNKITSIQKNIFQPLTELVNLDLSSNQLQEITNETFHGLRLLERLYLQKNRIQHIHATAFDTLENLLELKLQNNQLRAVPPLDLPNLLLLDISWNKIPTITPGALHAINIESLKIAGLGLTSLDEELFQPQNNLHELDVSDNLLERVPVVLRRLGSLTKLSLAGNAHISQLPPEDFRGLHNLQELDISNLNINTIPRDFSRFFPRLRAMTAAGNPFNCICQMSWLVQWVNASGVLLRRPEETRCHFPPKNSGKLLHHLQYADFGCPTTTTTTAAQPGTTGGFTFSSGTTTQAGTTGFNIGATSTAAPQAAPTGLTFGAAPAAAATTTASLGSTTQPAATPFSLGGQSSGLNFGSLISTAATGAPTATLTASTSQGPTLSFGSKLGVTTTASTTTAASTAPLLGSTGPVLFASIASSSAPPSSTSTGLSLGAPSTGTTGLGTSGFGLKPPGTTAAATSTATSTSASSFALNLKPLTTTGTIGAVTSTAAITTTTPSAPPVMTYAQLESLINKWSLELEDQEKHFLHQATQVNAWDRTLIENGEKITSLHREVEKVKLDQKRLDQELDFILSQQKELEDLLTPLEESVKEQSGTIYLQHADEERERTYKLAENIDAQLKRMAQDLKDIIEHLNTSGRPADTSDPLQQICKILNAHMDSLQWIDQNSALLQRKVEEVTKVCESRRKEQERSFRITFD